MPLISQELKDAQGQTMSLIYCTLQTYNLKQYLNGRNKKNSYRWKLKKYDDDDDDHGDALVGVFNHKSLYNLKCFICQF